MNLRLSFILAVGIGGALGSMLRYVVSVLVTERAGPGFPWGTLLINVTGSFILAVIAELSTTRVITLNPLARVLLTVGFVGGYTTFSTFTNEALALVGERAVVASFVYTMASLGGGLAAAYLGLVVARLVEIAR
ncbi:MAG TPA: fluoride efflux transporter CrcB [Candidatus Dormibacteraeota bacterium]|nr:fluoride efflux transporter CrcB [Candidatus Dormibacteraeota bacterium]